MSGIKVVWLQLNIQHYSVLYLRSGDRRSELEHDDVKSVGTSAIGHGLVPAGRATELTGT